MSPDEDDLFWVKPGDVKSFGEDQEMKSSSKSSSTRRRVEKKTKVRWTKDLHKKFLEAVGKLGIDKAVPKKIVELMKVDGLTRDHVASHLQKYRILSKKITNASLNNRVQTASKPSLLESSMTNDASWSQSSLMLNQEQMNQPSCGMHPISPLILDTSSSYFLTLDASKFNTTKNGYFTQAMTNNLNLEKQRNFVDDTTNSSVVNLVTSSNTGFVQYPETGFFHDYGGCSTEVQTYNNFEKGSSGGVPYSSNPPFVQNPNIFEISNYSSKKESVEIGSLYGASSNINLENGFSEDDMILSEDDMANLLSFADDYNLTASHDLSKQHLMDEQFVEPVWSPTLLQTIRQFKA
ncbi:putative two-component response regulator ARR13 [Helianthus annuus]|uniref:putative two-component response regulator ARR13 n=1 Tax=Helianthus annuus TaxID=4232 RepID=UPI000B903A84|nr:putative two-component response regulator ARR13 [Helianthus annuus]